MYKFYMNPGFYMLIVNNAVDITTLSLIRLLFLYLFYV